MDPGKTAQGSIPKLITFADLPLVGVDIEELADCMYEHESKNAKTSASPSARSPRRARARRSSGT